MPNGGELIITWSRMHAPSGYVLDRLGVLPGVCTSHTGGADAQPSDAGAPDSRAPDARASVRYAIESDFVAWHAYDHSDDAVARTLRLVCPAENGEDAADVALAESLLLDQSSYRRALRPWAGPMMAHRPPAAADLQRR